MLRRDLLGALALPLMAKAGTGKLMPVDEAGYRHMVASAKGKVLLVTFWATWCEPCRAEMPHLQKLAARLKAKGLNFVTISADEPEDEPQAREFLVRAGVAEPGLLKLPKNDEQFIEAIDSKWSGALPALFVYDRTGKKVNAFYGETKVAAVEAALTRLL